MIDRSTVQKVARLARLDVLPEETDVLAKELDAILSFVEKLAELDVSRVEPLRHAGTRSEVTRDDLIMPPMSQSEALQNAPEQRDGYFVVPRVIEEA